MVRLNFTLQTQSDLRNIYEYIALDSPMNAKRFVKELKQRAQILKKYPEIGHLVLPERFTKLRQLLHKSYRIVYHFSDDVVTIITIHHQTRLIENIPVIKGYEE